MQQGHLDYIWSQSIMNLTLYSKAIWITLCYSVSSFCFRCSVADSVSVTDIFWESILNPRYFLLLLGVNFKPQVCTICCCWESILNPRCVVFLLGVYFKPKVCAFLLRFAQWTWLSETHLLCVLHSRQLSVVSGLSKGCISECHNDKPQCMHMCQNTVG